MVVVAAFVMYVFTILYLTSSSSADAMFAAALVLVLAVVVLDRGARGDVMTRDNDNT